MLDGIRFLQSMFKNKRSLNDLDLDEFPLEMIPSHLKQYLFEKDLASRKKIKPLKAVYPYRYEFFVYDNLCKQISGNKVHLRDTTQYKNLTDDLKLKNTAKERRQLLNSLNCERLNQSAESLLSQLEAQLEPLIHSVNERIENGENKPIKVQVVNGKKIWTLPYQKKTNEYNNPFYSKIPTINLIDVLYTVNEECHFMGAFTHILKHGAQNPEDIYIIMACIIANATNFGTCKMGDSSDISYDRLRMADHNHIRLETLRKANDRVCKKFFEIPIVEFYKLGTGSHGAGDAQKQETRMDTFDARHSPKFFGRGKGIAPYSLGVDYTIVNCIPDKGAHQHESHFLFELIRSNTSGIDIDRISTDTEGSNQIMFLLMYFANIDYMPCYRNLRKRFNKLYGFKKLNAYAAKHLLNPSHKINTQLIIDEWENIQDIMAALLRNEVSISVITRKLCSYEMNDKTKRALWELNTILKSIYLLRYVDDPTLRRHVRAALNRVEAYHCLRKNIGETNGSSLRGGDDVEAAIWNECARLVANVVMYFNASFLSKLRDIKLKKGDLEGAEKLTRLSPIGSQHMNFAGRYEFSKGGQLLDIEKMLDMLDTLDIDLLRKPA